MGQSQTRALQEAWRIYPHTFAEVASGGNWLPYKHLVYTSKVITDALAKGGARIVISMPPRHGKSELISHWIPVWYLDNFIEKRIILCSYEAHFAAEWGQKVRDEIEGNPLVRCKVKHDKRAANNFRLANCREAGMKTAGVGGPITGRGADLLIIDDPVKNWEEAMSEKIRETHKRWYDSTADSRLEPGASVILLMTRWHEDDLAGYLIAEQGFKEVRLPAISEGKDDELGRKEGKALCPERYDEAALAVKRKVSERIWNGLYQQRPTSEEGALLKRSLWGYYQELPNPLDMALTVQSWDMAFKDLKTSDWVVGTVMGWKKRTEDYYIIDQVRGQWALTKSIAEVEKLTHKHEPARTKLIEDAANGAAVEDVLKKKMAGIKLIPAQGSKLARAMAIEPAQSTGHILLPDPKMFPEHAEWVKALIEECAAFPLGKHDDRVDSLSQGVNYLQQRATSSLHRLAEL